jgi:hypothetical protein
MTNTAGTNAATGTRIGSRRSIILECGGFAEDHRASLAVKRSSLLSARIWRVRSWVKPLLSGGSTHPALSSVAEETTRCPVRVRARQRAIGASPCVVVEEDQSVVVDRMHAGHRILLPRTEAKAIPDRDVCPSQKRGLIRLLYMTEPSRRDFPWR